MILLYIYGFRELEKDKYFQHGTLLFIFVEQ